MSFSEVVNRVLLNKDFSNKEDWEDAPERRSTIDFLGRISINFLNKSVSLEEFVSHINHLYTDFVASYELEREESFSRELRAENRKKAILGLRKVVLLRERATKNYGPIQKIYYVFIKLFRSLLLLDRGLNKVLQQSKDFEEKLSWFEKSVWENIAVGHKAKKTVTSQTGTTFFQAPREAVIPILENAIELKELQINANRKERDLMQKIQNLQKEIQNKETKNRPSSKYIEETFGINEYIKMPTNRVKSYEARCAQQEKTIKALKDYIAKDLDPGNTLEVKVPGLGNVIIYKS